MSLKAKISLLLFISVILSGCYTQNHQQNIQGKPIVGEPYSWDFGRVKEGRVLKYTFIFKNESKKTLTVKDINTSCGCTISKVKKKIILPAQSTSIEVQFNTKGYSGLTQQNIYVHTDNLDNPIVRFIIKADVIKSSQRSIVDSP